MSLIVTKYDLKESNKNKLPDCAECDYPVVWVVTPHMADKAKVAYACSQHVDTVLYLVDKDT